MKNPVQDSHQMHEFDRMEQTGKKNRRLFGIIVIAFQLLIAIIFGIFLRVDFKADTQLHQQFFPKFQDANAMILIGFGFAYAFMKKYRFTSLTYVFFMHAIGIQIYIVFTQFWKKAINENWQSTFLFTPVTIIGSFFLMASLLMGYGVIFGRTGPFQLVVFIIVGSFGYCVNQQIVFGIFKVFDFGGSLTIHAFGAYYGLAVSFVLARKYAHKLPVETDYTSLIFGAVGVFFLWPSYLTSNSPANGYTKSLTFSNTIIALTGSVAGCFVSTVLMHRKLSFGDVQTATLMGGITALSAGLLVNPAGNIIIGFVSGFLCVLGFAKLSPRLQQLIKTPDTLGAHNLHGLPCILSGLYSCVIFLFYSVTPIDEQVIDMIPFDLRKLNRTPLQQAGYQLVGVCISFGLAIVTGLTAGLIIYPFYQYQGPFAFSDQYFFQIDEGQTFEPEIASLSKQPIIGSTES